MLEKSQTFARYASVDVIDECSVYLVKIYFFVLLNGITILIFIWFYSLFWQFSFYPLDYHSLFLFRIMTSETWLPLSVCMDMSEIDEAIMTVDLLSTFHFTFCTYNQSHWHLHTWIVCLDFELIDLQNQISSASFRFISLNSLVAWFSFHCRNNSCTLLLLLLLLMY